jgi:hypothetical protein
MTLPSPQSSLSERVRARIDKLFYVYNFLGIPPDQRLWSPPALGKHVGGVEFGQQKQGEQGKSLATIKLYVDEKVPPDTATASGSCTCTLSFKTHKRMPKMSAELDSDARGPIH